MTEKEIKVLVFDIGGVLVELGGMQTMFEWTDFKYSAEELMGEWLASPVVRAYESGNSNAEVFCRGIIEEFNLQVPVNEFSKEFKSWPTKLFPGVKTLLRRLRSQYRLISLSNTNQMHWPRITKTLGLEPLFDHHFPSHLTGILKPDREAFAQVCQFLDLPPQSMLFFDDSRTNVEAAKSFGLHTAQVNGVLEVERFLYQNGLLKAA